jgi:hypothetical protein
MLHNTFCNEFIPKTLVWAVSAILDADTCAV